MVQMSRKGLYTGFFIQLEKKLQMDAFFSILDISYEHLKEITRYLVKKNTEKSETIASQASELSTKEALIDSKSNELLWYETRCKDLERELEAEKRTSMLNRVSCPVCHERFSDLLPPYVLQNCPHLICSKCPRRMTTRRGGVKLCPICRKVFRVESLKKVVLQP